MHADHIKVYAETAWNKTDASSKRSVPAGFGVALNGLASSSAFS